MKNAFLMISTVAFLCFFSACKSEKAASDATADTATASNTAENETATSNGSSSTAKSTTGGNVNWIKVTELEKMNSSTQKPVLIDLYTGWCGWCKRMDKTTFEHPEIAEYINKNFHPVKFDAEDKNSIDFQGTSYPFKAAGRRGYNELAHKFANGRMSYPTVAFLDKNLKRIDSYPGYKQPHQMDGILRFIAEDHYSNSMYKDFLREFKSEIPPLSQEQITKKKAKPRIEYKKEEIIRDELKDEIIN